MAPQSSELSAVQKALLEKRLRGDLNHSLDAQFQNPKPLVPRPANIPMSHSQERFWILQQLDGEQGTYNLAILKKLIGPLNVPVLEKSLQEIVRRHEALRTRYLVQDGVLYQEIDEDANITLDLVDLTEIPVEEREDKARSLAMQQIDRPFDLARELALRMQLLKLNENEHILVITMHHISTDGWSMGVFWCDLTALYNSFIKGEASPLPALPVQYADYAVWQRAWLEGARQKKQLAYWREQLCDLAVQDMPTDRPYPPMQTHHGEELWFELPVELQTQLQILSRREGVTLFMTMLAAYSLLMKRYSRQEDIAVGTVVANRRRPEIENLIGLFTNNLVLRMNLSGNPTFVELLKRSREVALDAYDNQDIPFEMLLKELQPVRDISRTPLFQTMLVLQNMPYESFSAADLTIENFSLGMEDREGSALDLSLYLYESANGLYGRFEFNTNLFDRTTIERLANHFETLLEAIAAEPEQAIDSMPILTSGEEAQQNMWNETSVDSGDLPDIVSQFYEQAGRHPQETAFTFEGRLLTYGELNERSNRLAHYLIAKSVQPGMRVGLALERSLEMPIALLAIFKVGGVYVPLDISYPEERLRFIIEDSEIGFLLTSTQWQQTLLLDEVEKTRVVCLDTIEAELEKESIQDLDLRSKADDIAYIIYTSGSLGQPKGVEVPHRQILNRLAWMWEAYPIEVEEVGCQKTALNFVDSLWELLGYLLQGAPTVIISNETVKNSNMLVETLAREKVTRLWLVPSLLRAILKTQSNLQEQLPHLTAWVCSGEELPVDLAQQFEERLPNAVLYNLYGTSEVWDVTWYDPQKEEAIINGSTIPIGRPISNMRTYILDEGRNPVPVGVPGELYVGGVGLGRGYIKQPQLTAENFMPDPFVKNGDRPGELSEGVPRMYSTGDLACWLPDGNIEFLGRVDWQIKIRGYRVEPGEIEALLQKHDSITDAAVIVYGEDQGKRLVAYVMATEVDEELPTILRRYLAIWLPLVIVPWRIVPIEEFPLTPSGKVDRKALAQIELEHLDRAEEFVAPRTAIEETLVEIWAEVLKIEHIGIHSNFFELGGHSLLGIILFARIEEQLGQRLPVRTLFQAPTVAQLGAVIEQTEGNEEQDLLVPFKSSGSRPPFFCVHFFGGTTLGYVDLADQLGPDQPFYGLEAVGLDGNAELDESIEMMASRNIETMRRVQPSGPYRIGGYCLGGVVAFEMARQLEAQGETAALVAIMEGFSPVEYDEALPLIHPQRLLATWKSIPYWLQDYSRLGYDRFLRKARRKINKLRNQIRQRRPEEAVSAILETDLDQLAPHQRQVMITHLQALRRYQGGYYGGKVVLLRAEHQTINRTVFGALDPAYGWGRLARGGVDVQMVNGVHRNIHLKPYVPSLASKLADSLEAVNSVE